VPHRNKTPCKNRFSIDLEMKNRCNWQYGANPALNSAMRCTMAADLAAEALALGEAEPLIKQGKNSGEMAKRRVRKPARQAER